MGEIDFPNNNKNNMCSFKDLYADVLLVIAEFADDHNVLRAVCRECRVMKPEKVTMEMRARRCFVMGYKNLGMFYYKMLGKKAFSKLKAICGKEYYITIPPEIIAENLDEDKIYEEVPVGVYLSAAFDEPPPSYKGAQIRMIATRYAWVAGKGMNRDEFSILLLALITMSDNYRYIEMAYDAYAVVNGYTSPKLSEGRQMELLFLALVFNRLRVFDWLCEEKFPKLSLCVDKLYEARKATGDNYCEIMLDIAELITFYGAPSDFKQYVLEKIVS
ncbi:hypothetical protein BNJ_00068 [Kaumoebavirus]|uniref:hypothetical protein n=1 Tax=Kaumoebavirus TaxID=1859492 RepID=UPI0009C1FBB9|nr:hypothetical protein BNJ_00068 [Kaumoebavirus]ARA71910.1 hypothetical protein BNJ_00068 [Kaumoebavirus]